ncbi:response regulator [Ktedonosporobacter rubrisoli]|nr:response regulator [Ktedonosporobacter rubrisoli]
MQKTEDKTDKTILVAEDDDGIGTMLVEMLSQETPYKALRVSDGRQALQEVRRIKPELFITDYGLPYMNGLELYDHLKNTEELEDTPTIIMSAQLPKEEVKKRGLIALSKPFDLDEFLNLVKRLLNKTRNGGSRLQLAQGG